MIYKCKFENRNVEYAKETTTRTKTRKQPIGTKQHFNAANKFRTRRRPLAALNKTVY